MEYFFTGQIELFPYSYAPMDWEKCDGSTLSISSNRELFDLLGTAFGGDGTSTFRLPDLRNASPHPNMQYCIALYGVHPPRG